MAEEVARAMEQAQAPVGAVVTAAVGSAAAERVEVAAALERPEGGKLETEQQAARMVGGEGTVARLRASLAMVEATLEMEGAVMS